jgi:hypothetical protein
MLYVAFLFASLGSPDFEARESASARLAHLVDRHPAIYGPRLGAWAASATCPEVRRRSNLILVTYHRWRVNSFVPSGCPVYPICDAFPIPHPALPAFTLLDVRDRCRWPASHATGDIGGPHWTAYRRGTAARVRAMLVDGVPPEECDRLLSRMWVLEQAACGDVSAERWAVSASWVRWAGGFPRP